VGKIYLAAFLSRMNHIGNSKLQNLIGLQSMMPAAQLYIDLFPGQKLGDCMTELILNYVDNSWLKFWPVEMEKKIFRVSSRDLEEQHIRFLREFKEQSMAKKLGQSDIKSILMLKFEPHPQSPNKLILIEILLLHKLSLMYSTLHESATSLANILSDICSLSKIMMYYLDFEFTEDMMAQRRCQYTYITMLVSVLSALIDCYGQLEEKSEGNNGGEFDDRKRQFDEEANFRSQGDENLSKRHVLYYTTRDIIDFLKLCLSISYQGNKKLFDEVTKTKGSESRFFSSVATGGKPEDAKPICVVFSKQILKMTQKQDDASSSESPIKLEPILKKPQKGMMFSSKKANLLELNTGIDASTSAASDKSELLIDKDEVLQGLPNVFSREDKLQKFLAKSACLNTHEIRQQYLSRLSMNSLQLRADFNEYLASQRASISDNIDPSIRLESSSTSKRLRVVT
jgi:hypothetical protein